MKMRVNIIIFTTQNIKLILIAENEWLKREILLITFEVRIIGHHIMKYPEKEIYFKKKKIVKYICICAHTECFVLTPLKQMRH